MNLGLPLLGLGITLALVIGIALWILSSSSRSSGERREELEARRVSHQPWDSADGRANR